MKIYQLINTLAFCEQISNTKISIKTAYKINQIKNFISGDVDFYRSKMQEIVSKYGIMENGEYKLDPSGKTILIQPDKINECQSEVRELEEIEKDLTGAPKIKIDELGDIEITARELECLMPFLEV